MRPNPISERDWRLVARVRGPSKVGETACFSTKLSGNLRSAGRDSLLLISSWLVSLRGPPGLWRIFTPPYMVATVVPLVVVVDPAEVAPGVVLTSFWPRLAGDTTSSEVREPSSLSPSLPIRGCSCTTPEKDIKHIITCAHLHSRKKSFSVLCRI